MSFLKAKSLPVTIFKLGDDAEFTADTLSALRNFAMVNTPEPDATQQTTYGLVGLGDELDTGFDEPIDYGDSWRFSLCVDSRRIPASTLKREFAKAMKDELREMQRQGRNVVPRQRKMEIKEQLKIRLIPKMPWTTSLTDVVILPQERRMYVFSKNKFALDTISDIAANVFSGRPDALMAEQEKGQDILAGIYETALIVGDYEVAYSGKGAKLVKSTENGKESASVVHADPAMVAGIRDDMSISKMSLYCRSTDGNELNDIYMDVTDMLEITKLVLPKVEHTEGDEDNNGEAFVRLGWVQRAEKIIQGLCDLEVA